MVAGWIILLILRPERVLPRLFSFQRACLGGQVILGEVTALFSFSTASHNLCTYGV